MTVSHPAKFSDPILAEISDWIRPPARILDPFAGTGRIHELYNPSHSIHTFGVEIEPEWAEMHIKTSLGNALDLNWPDQWFDYIITSPAYGNRMADHHDAKDGSKRLTYRHSLGRALHPDNSGRLQWGDKYREFHEKTWREAVRVLKGAGDGGRHGQFILNISDHIRDGKRVPVSTWHVECLERLGLRLIEVVEVETKRMGMGANREARVGCEYVVVMEKP